MGLSGRRGPPGPLGRDASAQRRPQARRRLLYRDSLMRCRAHGEQRGLRRIFGRVRGSPHGRRISPSGRLANCGAIDVLLRRSASARRRRGDELRTDGGRDARGAGRSGLRGRAGARARPFRWIAPFRSSAAWRGAGPRGAAASGSVRRAVGDSRPASSRSCASSPPGRRTSRSRIRSSSAAARSRPRRQILGKLGVANRTEAVARRFGTASPDRSDRPAPRFPTAVAQST